MTGQRFRVGGIWGNGGFEEKRREGKLERLKREIEIVREEKLGMENEN